MNSQSRKELLPCPFCGSKATMAEFIHEGVAWKYDGVNGFIECINDDCILSAYNSKMYWINDDPDENNKDDVIKAWNARATSELSGANHSEDMLDMVKTCDHKPKGRSDGYNRYECRICGELFSGDDCMRVVKPRSDRVALDQRALEIANNMAVRVTWQGDTSQICTADVSDIILTYLKETK